MYRLDIEEIYTFENERLSSDLYYIVFFYGSVNYGFLLIIIGLINLRKIITLHINTSEIFFVKLGVTLQKEGIS